MRIFWSGSMREFWRDLAAMMPHQNRRIVFRGLAEGDECVPPNTPDLRRTNSGR